MSANDRKRIHAILPRRGRGTTRRVVEGHRRLTRRARLNGPHISGKGAVTHYLIGKANRLCTTTILRMRPPPQVGCSSAHPPTEAAPQPDRGRGGKREVRKGKV